MAYEVRVKNGDTKYNYDEKTGQYTNKVVDYVEESETLAGALYTFLEWTTDDYNDYKVSLIFTPDKKSKKNKKDKT